MNESLKKTGNKTEILLKQPIEKEKSDKISDFDIIRLYDTISPAVRLQNRIFSAIV